MRPRWRSVLLITFFAGALLVIFWPIPRVPGQFSSVVLDQNSSLLSARVASDEQWRFPTPDTVPHKIERCILLYEDEYFFYHPGFNPVSIIRATYQNIKAGKVISGASTITMQLARMLYRQDRTLVQKLKEVIASLHLELFHSKDDILRLYTTHAPYGGNIVGLEAAAWKYFDRSPDELSWAESALLAVLPNDPASLYPGRNPQKLAKKRNDLLRKLYDREIVDKTTFELAKSEPIPKKPSSIDFTNMHLLDRCSQEQGSKRYQTTIDPRWQSLTNEILKKHHSKLSTNGIENIAALVIDLEKNLVLAYCGNISDPSAEEFQVDIIPSRRSSGSLLKPFLYALAIDRGMLTPQYLLPDIPTYFAGFTPKNFNEKYEGMVPAKVALSRSLNIPFVHLLKEYQFEQFQVDLAKMQLTTVDPQTDRYGLSLVLGGAEVTMWDIAQTYSQLYRHLAGYEQRKISLFSDKSKDPFDWNPPSRIAIWHMFDAMTELVRPGSNKNWEKFESSQKISWKTGTSFGFRDAWAVGLNGKVLAAVWAGNADGEGRSGLIGSQAAGPALLELLKLAEYENNWLEKLQPVGKQWDICTASGHKATSLCHTTKKIDLPKAAELLSLCEYHKEIVVEPSHTYRVNSSCFPVYETRKDTVFILPANAVEYYAKNHPGYMGMPPLHPECLENESQIQIIYPTETSRVYLPKTNFKREQVILQAAHSSQNSTIFWHIDEKYIGRTTHPHHLTVSLGRGIYQLKIVDSYGQQATREIRVISE